MGTQGKGGDRLFRSLALTLTGDWYSGEHDEDGNPINAWDFERDGSGKLTGTGIVPTFYASGCEAPTGSETWQHFVDQGNGNYYGEDLSYYTFECTPGPLAPGAALRGFESGGSEVLEIAFNRSSQYISQVSIEPDGSVLSNSPVSCFILGRNSSGPSSWPPAACAESSAFPSAAEQGGAPNRSERRTTCSRAHPVNCATGVFWHQFTDARIPGRGVPLEFTRTYSSMNAGHDGPLGFGWSDSYAMSLAVDGETGAATIYEEDGSSVTFDPDGGGGFEAPPQVLATLSENEDGTYSFVRFSEHVSYVFAADGRLLREVDRNGNATVLTYAGGLLSKVTDPSGRSLTFAYSDGRIHAVTDPMGRMTTFGYDAGGNLKEATDPMGRTWSFSYDSEHRLVTMTDPRGGTISNTYDSSGRVVAQTDPMGRESTWVYEGEAAEGVGATTLTDGRGDVTRYGYRDLELLSVTRGVGSAGEATTSYEYDPSTLGVSSITDADGHVNHNRYDGHGNLIETTDPMGRTTVYSYGSGDEVLSATDPRGTTTTYRYDLAGNLLEEETPDTETGEIAKTEYRYEAAPGELTAETDPDGHTTTFGYDTAGDRISVTDADGNQTTFAYDADGEVVSKTSPAGNEPGGNPAAHTNAYAYDADGELTSETDQLGHVTTYGYDDNGNQTALTDANGHTTHRIYDADGELIELVRPDGSILKTAWDAAGNMTAQIDGAGHGTTYGYDALGRVVSMIDPDGRTTSFEYDPAGNRTGVTNAEGQLTTYIYDLDSELTAIFYSDGSTPSAFEEYDEDGNRITLTDGTGTSTFAYDSLNRMTDATDGAGEHVGYEYDLAGHPIKLTYPNGQSVTRAYDPAGNLVAVTDWLGHTTHFSYDADSNLGKESYGNGVAAQFGYDAADRLSSITDSNGVAQVASFAYSRDPEGQVTSEVSEDGEPSTTDYSRNSLDQLTGADATSYGYDAADNPTTFGAAAQQFDPANELTSIRGPGVNPEEGGEAPGSDGSIGSPAGGSSAPTGSGSTPLSKHSPARRKSRHCRKGFRKRRVHGKTKCVRVKKKRRLQADTRAGRSAQAAREAQPAGRADRVRTSISQLRVSSPSANGGGEGLRDALDASVEVTRHFTYNARGDRTMEDLATGGSRALSYDQADRLIGVGSGVTYAYNGDGLRTSKIIDGIATAEVWDQAEALPELLAAGSTSYVYGAGGQPIEQISGGTATFLQTDGQGSVRLLTAAAGAVVGRYAYDPWGNVVGHTGSAVSELQFDGQLTDAETGFQYLRARYYDPRTGQFLSQDLAFTLTRSRYAFTSDKPTDYFDPSGLGLCLLGHNPNGSCRGGSEAVTTTKVVHVVTGAVAVGATACAALGAASVIGAPVGAACGVGALAAGGLTLASGEALYATGHESTGGLLVDLGGVVPVGKLFGRLEHFVDIGIGLYGTYSSVHDWNYSSGSYDSAPWC